MADSLPSRFLPPDFDPTAPVAVVAGQRDYPRLTVEGLRKAGIPTRLIALRGETAKELIDQFPADQSALIKVGQVGGLLKALRRLEARYCLFVGQVSPGKLFRDLAPDLKALTLLGKLRERNAHTIFGAIAREIEAIGVTMLDARAFMDAHLSDPATVMTRTRPDAPEETVRFGIRMAREIARLDIGQGVVVRKGTVLAVEAFEGTDDMLQRANKYKTDGLLFVKCAKHQQNPCFDWPVFGRQTLHSMQKAGIQAAALQGHGVVMLQKPELLQLADKAGIALTGF